MFLNSIENRNAHSYGTCGADLGQLSAEVTDNIHAIGVVKPVYRYPTFHLPQKQE